MSREETNQIRYIIALIAEFAKKFNLGQRQAYNYLKRFKGIDYLMSFYDVLHTQSFEDAIHDISIICERNGGTQKYQIQTNKTIELTNEQIDMMKEDICVELIALLMKGRHYTMSETIDMLYNSDTYNRIQDQSTGLYYQSPGYSYAFLQQGFLTGDYRR
jgi:hypothetical protein